MKDYLEKILSLKEIEREVLRLKHTAKTIVFTNGCFDMLHAGHARLLHQARDLGDILIVGLNNDASVSAIKGPDRPIHSEIDRSELLAALECVDYVVLFEQETPQELIALILPDILVKGADWENNIVGRDVVEARGGKVVSLPLSEGLSSTAIIQKIKKLKE